MIVPKTAFFEIFSFSITAAIGRIKIGLVALSAPAIEASMYLSAKRESQKPPKTTTKTTNKTFLNNEMSLRGARQGFNWRVKQAHKKMTGILADRRINVACKAGTPVMPFLASMIPTVVQIMDKSL